MHRRSVPGVPKLAAALLLFAAAACTDSVAPEPRAEPQDRIFFVSNRDGAPAVYLMNVDGTGLRRVTVPGSWGGLRLSPDGGWIAFHGADPASCPDIWVMRSSDTAATRLTGVVAFERCNYWPRWSPDGARIAFISSRDPQRGWDAFVMQRDGGGVVNVSNNPATLAELDRSRDNAHDWTPDGRVVLLSTRDGTLRTWLVQPDGSGIQAVAVLPDSVYPYWSPNGTRIAFQTLAGEIHVVGTDGTSELNLSNHPAYDAFGGWSTPWSPNGQRIAFSSDRSGNPDIWVVNAGGTGLVNVTRDPGADEFLQWLPDGEHILFSSDRSGDREVYTIRADGTAVRNLTNAPGVHDERAVWVPRQ